MRRLSRLNKSIYRLRPRSTPSSSSFLCSAYLRRAPFSTTVRCFAEPGKISRTESLRRRIWGTDKPPGLEDPYGGPSFLEERRAARAMEDSTLKEEEPAKDSELRETKTLVPSLDPSYEPAKTWDGLEEVGELPAPEFYFEGFMAEEKVTDPCEATAALHRAVVEVFALRQIGRPLSELSNTISEVDKTRNVQISVPASNPSSPLLQYPEGWSAETILETLDQKEPHQEDGETVDSIKDASEPDTSEKASIVGSDTAKDAVTDLPELIEVSQLMNFEQQATSWNSSWLGVSLEDPEIKFAVVKRVMQLTGIRIPDATMHSAYTVRSLLTQIIQKPKPAKLFDALVEKQDLVTLPNVKLFSRRITPIDKEKMVGRWKIIERELQNRGLPVTGHSR